MVSQKVRAQAGEKNRTEPISKVVFSPHRTRPKPIRDRANCIWSYRASSILRKVVSKSLYFSKCGLRTGNDNGSTSKPSAIDLDE